MSEKIYARLLRLYPRAFRKVYEGEALKLIRDRFRDETGLVNRARLWWDLTTDLLHGLPQAYENSYAAAETAPLPAHAESIPSFKVLDTQPLGPGSILVAGTLSLAASAAFGFLLSRPMAFLPLPGSNGRMSPIEAVIQRLNQAMDPDSADRRHGNPSTVATSGAREPVAHAAVKAAAAAAAPNALIVRAANGMRGDTIVRAIPYPMQKLNERHVNPERARAVLSQSKAQGMENASANGTVSHATESASLDSLERRLVLDHVIGDVRQYYFDRDVAKKTADVLLVHEKSGDYDSVTDGALFADLLTRQMREASGDMHFSMEYTRERLPNGPPAQTPADVARFRQFLEQNNCFFNKVEMLRHRIGYVKLNWFADASTCQPTAVAAMASLNSAHAVIFDLRDCTGGTPEMVALMASYLFDHPVYWYSPRSTPNENSWTRSPVARNHLADKPVYILTSSATASGAEQFSYDLKMLRRATLVGETTRGAAHAGVFHRIDDHFGIGIPEVKPVNPFGKTDWEGVGVEPDVNVTSADALETTVKLAEARTGNQ